MSKSSKKTKTSGLSFFQKAYLVGLICFCVLIGSVWLLGAHYLPQFQAQVFNKVLRGEWKTELYQLEGMAKTYYQGGRFRFESFKEANFANLNHWKTFQIHQFLVPLPYRHPSYIVEPIVVYKGKQENPTVGLKFFGALGAVKNRFMIGRRFAFKVNLFDQKLFNLPISRNVILNKSVEDIWHDLFVLDTKQASDDYKLNIYKLFILDLRQDLFPKDVQSFGYHPNLRLGILSLKVSNSQIRKEVVWKMKNGWVEEFEIESRVDDYSSEEIRRKFIALAKFDFPSQEKVEELYKDYMQLKYRERIGAEGFLYLFSLWSQDLGNKRMLAEMIHFLERGKDNFRQLKPLYAYAYARYGTNFSSDETLRQEADSERIKREELEEEKNQLNRQMSGDYEESSPEFKTPEEKVWYKLNQSKKNSLKNKAKKQRLLSH